MFDKVLNTPLIFVFHCFRKKLLNKKISFDSIALYYWIFKSVPRLDATFSATHGFNKPTITKEIHF